ncbi:MAG: N-acetylmuramoyl-L-alanine amidase family protein [Limisphaerales bacterium]|jgi:N-acetylmuramoyl-L-alanine amidase|nr:N-acetylmuramoyl-L-alanine amidase [Verrucomicrobiota bacterium]
MMQIQKRNWVKKILLLGSVASLCFLVGHVQPLWSQTSKVISLPVKKKAPAPKVTTLASAAPAPAPAKAATTATGYQSLLLWGKKYGLKAYWIKKDKVLRLADGTHTLEFEVNRSCIEVNRVRIWIGKPVKIVSGRISMDAQDIDTALEPVLAPKKRKAVQVVLLDPGHGGADPGAVFQGKREKDYVLLLAKEVQRILQQRGVKVVLTRNGDQALGLSARSNMSARTKADLFVSIHLNAAANSAAKGAEVFTTTPAGAQSTNPDRSGSRSRTTGNANDTHNLLLAYQIQQELTRQIGFADRGVRRDRLGVLVSNPVPAVLVEAGFITNSDDQKKIFNKSQRDQVARAIADGILNYKKAVETGRPSFGSPTSKTVNVQKL